MGNIEKIVNAQKAYFNTNTTKDVAYRIAQLKKLKALIQANEQEIFDAIYADFGKSEFETYLTELALLRHEIDLCIKKTKRWSKRKRVWSGIANFPSKSYIIPEPLGVCLVIGAWNYPYQLSLLPALTALAAGNTVIMKPSELPSRTSAVMAKMINEHFAADYFHVIEGGVEETTELLNQPFDKIFFTGSIPVGKIVYEAAAKNLTPVTLELGGKSPTFVLQDADLKMTAKRIAWAKFINAGQTCVAPDYILVEKSIEDKFIEALKVELENYPQSSDQFDDNYVKIINTKNFDRLSELIDKEKVCYGGNQNREERFISPTIMKNVSFDDPIMEDEIFGPILPILSFSDLNQAIHEVKARPKPLSCYVYSKNKSSINKLLHEVSFGGGCVNDSIMHLAVSKLPFGGVGHSGIGSYHGKVGFDTFSHQKSILHKGFWFEPPIKYAPYSPKKLKIIRWLIG
ncbi:MAG: aldehyde dehydrogenase [Flavobacteriales bacterium]|nr:aldehyde dehydrogenase [Flavobacteriales bacterium]